jgi:hypothetical protein
MNPTERQRRWRRDNRAKAEATRQANASRPETKQRRRDRYRETHPEPQREIRSRAEIQREWRAANYARVLFHRCKSSATRRSLPFDLTIEYVAELLRPMRCAVTGVELVIDDAGARNGLQPSVDQIRPGEGYLQSNVRIVSWIFNRAKGTGTDREVLAMALALIQQSAMQTII